MSFGLEKLLIVNFVFLQVVNYVSYYDEDVVRGNVRPQILYSVLPVYDRGETLHHHVHTIHQFILKWHIMFKLFSNYNYQSCENNVIRILYRV